MACLLEVCKKARKSLNFQFRYVKLLGLTRLVAVRLYGLSLLLRDLEFRKVRSTDNPPCYCPDAPLGVSWRDVAQGLGVRLRAYGRR